MSHHNDTERVRAKGADAMRKWFQRHFVTEGQGEIRANRKIISRPLSQKKEQYIKEWETKNKGDGKSGVAMWPGTITTQIL